MGIRDIKSKMRCIVYDHGPWRRRRWTHIVRIIGRLLEPGLRTSSTREKRLSSDPHKLPRAGLSNKYKIMVTRFRNGFPWDSDFRQVLGGAICVGLRVRVHWGVGAFACVCGCACARVCAHACASCVRAFVLGASKSQCTAFVIYWRCPPPATQAIARHHS